MRSGTHSTFRWHVVKHVDESETQADTDCFGNQRRFVPNTTEGILCDQLWAIIRSGLLL